MHPQQRRSQVQVNLMVQARYMLPPQFLLTPVLLFLPRLQREFSLLAQELISRFLQRQHPYLHFGEPIRNHHLLQFRQSWRCPQERQGTRLILKSPGKVILDWCLFYLFHARISLSCLLLWQFQSLIYHLHVSRKQYLPRRNQPWIGPPIAFSTGCRNVDTTVNIVSSSIGSFCHCWIIFSISSGGIFT